MLCCTLRLAWLSSLQSQEQTTAGLLYTLDMLLVYCTGLNTMNNETKIMTTYVRSVVADRIAWQNTILQEVTISLTCTYISRLVWYQLTLYNEHTGVSAGSIQGRWSSKRSAVYWTQLLIYSVFRLDVLNLFRVRVQIKVNFSTKGRIQDRRLLEGPTHL